MKKTDGATLLLVNPNARSGNEQLGDLLLPLQDIGAVIAPKSLGREAVGKAIARHAGSVARVVIGGGDGSLHAALPAVLEAKLPLGVLPLGTANDFARSLGIASVSAAVETIVSGFTRPVDVGIVNGIYFLNAVGIGLGPEINRNLDKESKSSLGVLAYLVHAIRNLRRSRGMSAVIECDGSLHALKSLQITIGNGIHYGGGMTIARDARLDDGILDVLSIPPQGLFSLLLKGPAIRSGDAGKIDELQTFRASEVRVRTRRPRDVTADGEQVTRTPIECRVLPGRLQVFAPSTRE
ncbi:MAG TPA: lipid kinase [Woeseiaceae bacterium]|nr:lipid kinase [Woeseiaceae bacterium]